MTAEIAILNKAAVALAADSTVTIRSVTEPFQIKTYQSANKLFTISKHHPVGAMIFGNAALMDVPWETLIKQYRKQLAYRCFGTVKEYSNDFVSFLEQLSSIFTDDLQRRYFLGTTFQYFQNPLLDVITKQVQLVSNPPGGPARKAKLAEIGAIGTAVVLDHWKQLEAAKLCLNLNKRYENALLKDRKVDIEAIAKAVFKMPLSAAAMQALARIAVRNLCAAEVWQEELLSGIVFAGFGEDQIFPAIESCSPLMLIRQKLIHRNDSSYAITHDDDAALFPFAQTDVVDTFVKGINRTYIDIVRAELEGFTTSYPEKLADAIGETDPARRATLVDTVGKDLVDFTDKVRQRVLQHQQKRHVDPLLAVVGMLPKNELAEIAEALVNLTSAKRKMSRDVETVGGPVDVAVISKGDGFIWIRRKHYFRPELNPHFVRGYLKEVGNDGRKRKRQIDH